nr:THAP domain-containing protein 2-like isoform X4 [Penaeus vannamei]
MPRNCAVVGCRSGNLSRDILYHRFPKEEGARKEWAILSGKKKVNCETERICSLHFEKTDYERRLKYEMLHLPVPRNMRILKKGAIPSKLIPQVKGDDQPSEDENTEAARRKLRISQKETELQKETPTTYKKRKVFRMSEEESVFVVEGIGTDIQDGTCKKEVSSRVEDDGMDSLGENLTIKQEIMDSERGEDSLPENKDWNLSETVEVKEEITIKEEQVEVFDFPGCV